jgi:MFS family permease
MSTDNEATPEPPRDAALWKLRDVQLTVPARGVSLTGDSVLAIVLLLYLEQKGSGVWPVALVLAAQALPLVLLMGVAGYITDTCDSRKILVTATTAQLLGCVALAYTSSLAAIMALVLVIQVGQAFTGPTWAALVPRIVGEQAVGRMIALQSGLASLAAPAGAGLGGLLFGLAGARTAILADAGSFALLALAAASVKTRRNAPADEEAPQRPTAKDLLAAFRTTGFSALHADEIVWPLVWALVVTIVVVGGVNVVDVFLVRQSLHTPAAWYGVSEIVAAAGGVAGATIAAKITSDRARVTVTLTGYIAVGLACIGAGLSPDFPVYLIFAAAIGLANTALNATFGAVLIGRTPENLRGRAVAALNGLVQTGLLISLLFGGIAGSLAGPRATFITAGAFSAAVTLIAAGTVARYFTKLPSATSTRAQ